MKKHQLKSALFAVAALFTTSLLAQDWASMMQNPQANFHETQKAFEKFRQDYIASYKVANNGATPVKVPGEKIFRRWEWFMTPRVNADGSRFPADAVWNAMSEYKKGADKPMAGNWTLLGPSSSNNIPGIGRLNAIRVHPTNPSTLFVCAPSGGLWKSTDDGSTWSTTTDQHQVIGCSDVAFDPGNPNTMYLATGDCDGGDNYSVGLLKSTDGGTTWGPTGLSFSLAAYVQIARVLVDPTNANTIIVAASNGVYRSTDAGVTFTKATNTALAPPNNALAGNFKDMEFKPGTPATMYVCGTEFFRSTNGGVSWTKATGSLPAATAVQRMAIAVTPADVNAVYLVAMKATTYDMEGIYKSTNSGSSFPAKIATPNIGNQGFYDLCIAVNPSNANEVMLGGQTQFLKNTNGGSGATWPNVIGSMHVDFHDVVYTSSSTLYVCSDGGVWKSTNNGSSWVEKTGNLAISQLYGFGQSAINANKIIGGWQDNGTNYYNGSGWANAMGGDGMLAFISKGSNDNIMWGSQYNGSLNRSTSGFGGFAPMAAIPESCPWVTEWNEDPVAFGTVYAGCANVWKATANTFTKLPGNVGTGTVTITAIGVSPANTQIIYAAKGGVLYKSTNAGTSFAAVSGVPLGVITDIQCHPTDANKAWITYSGFSNVNKVWQTTNGTTWTNISASLPNIPINCITIDKNGNDALYVGTDAGVFFKDASLTVWQPFSTGLPRVVVSQLDIHYGTPAKLRASTYGRSVWESTLYQAGAYPPDANFAGNVLIGCPGLGVQFSDYTAGQPTSWSWTFQGGNPATSTAQNPFVAYNTPGTYSVSLTATNANGSDSQTFTSYISISTAQAPPTSSSYTICGPVAVTLTATPAVTPGTVRWWTAPAGGTLLGSDNTAPYSISPTLWGTQTVYVDEAFPAGNLDIVGANDNTFGNGAVFTANDIRGLYFDVMKPVVINSVKMYTGSAGLRTIEILDVNGNLVTDTTLNVANSGTVTPTTVTINRTVYPGTNYFIKLRGTVDAYRNSDGAAYPYLDGGSGSITITNSNAGAPGYYYFFYDWNITPIVCNTSRTAVQITDNCSLTGVNEVGSANLLNVYPNPSNGEFMLTFHAAKSDNYTIKIVNAIGQKVYEEALNNFSGDFTQKMDISSYGKGTYMLSVTNSSNETLKKVLVH